MESNTVVAPASFTAAQVAQRVNSLEDLLRRNENSLSHVLARLKDVELAVNNVHRVTSKVAPELSLVVEEVGLTKRKADAIDNTWRSKAQELEGIIQRELKSCAEKPQVSADPIFMRNVSDVQVLKQDVEDLKLFLKRVADSASVDSKALRQVEQDTRWVGEQLKEQISNHRDLLHQTQKKNEQFTDEIAQTIQQQEQAQTEMRTFVEGALRAMREEMTMRLENEARARIALQNDVVNAFAKMREDVVKGFAQTATNLCNLDGTTHSLEAVLRAEVRSRMDVTDDLAKRTELVEERLKRETSSAAEYLKALDTQMSGALRDVKEATASECRSQLDRVWRTLDEVQEKLHKVDEAASSASPSQSQNEVSQRRIQLQLETEIRKAKEEVLTSVDRRIENLGPRTAETPSSKAELHNLKEGLELRMDELRAEFEKKCATSVDLAAAKSRSSMATLEARVELSEGNLRSVAEALHSSQVEMTDKIEKMELQAEAMERLQKNLQSNFDKDQQQMEVYLNGIRDQVVLMAEEQAKANGTAKTGDEPKDGAAENEKVPPAAYSLLNQQLGTLESKLRELDHELRQELCNAGAKADGSLRRTDEYRSKSSEEMSRLRQEVEAMKNNPATTDEKTKAPKEASKANLDADQSRRSSATFTVNSPCPKTPPDEVAALKRRIDDLETRVMRDIDSVRQSCAADNQKAKGAADRAHKDLELLKKELADEVFPQLRSSIEDYIQTALKDALRADETRESNRKGQE